MIKAAHEGHKDAVELLLSRGADVNAEDEEGNTALSRAMENGYKDLAELLLKNGAKR